MNADENLILDELSKKKVTTWQRLASFFIDTVLFIGIYFALFFTVGNIAISNIPKNSIGIINEAYKTECVNREVPYKEGTYGIYEVDKDKYVEKILSNFDSYDSAINHYNDVYYEIDTAIQSYDGYSKAYNKFASTYYTTLLTSALIPALALFFILPACTKKKKTVGMLITKTSLAQDKTNIVCSTGRVATRFFTIYAIEFALGYVVGQLFGLGFVILINIVLICFTKKKKTIHDFFTQCHLEKDEFTYTE